MLKSLTISSLLLKGYHKCFIIIKLNLIISMFEHLLCAILLHKASMSLSVLKSGRLRTTNYQESNVDLCQRNLKSFNLVESMMLLRWMKLPGKHHKQILCLALIVHGLLILTGCQCILDLASQRMVLEVSCFEDFLLWPTRALIKCSLFY